MSEVGYGVRVKAGFRIEDYIYEGPLMKYNVSILIPFMFLPPNRSLHGAELKSWVCCQEEVNLQLSI